MPDPRYACRAGECRLLRTDIDVLRVEARLKQPDELTAPAAQVDGGSGRGPRQQRIDDAPVNKSSRFGSAAAGVL